MQGRIVENRLNLYMVEMDGKIYEAMPRGKFRKDDITPVVGDIVEIKIIDEENKKAIIEEVLKRDVYIKRPKISNITQIILVISSKDPKPDLLMLDRQLAFCEFLGISVLIVLNKIDLDKKQEFINIKTLYSKIGYKVFETDAKNKIGVEEFRKELKGKINAFSGNSGVRKVNSNK